MSKLNINDLIFDAYHEGYIDGVTHTKGITDFPVGWENSGAKSNIPTIGLPSVSVNEEAAEQIVQERDNAEEALSRAYYLIMGRAAEWSNNFGHVQALEDIDDAQR